MSASDPKRWHAAIAAEQQALARHPVYAGIEGLERLRGFVECHVACVWDFMSLLKSLQRDLADTTLPWRPPADPEAARLINDIVRDEESDVLGYRPGHGSHFTWYVEAMAELGADTGPIERFLTRLEAGVEPLEAMRAAGLPAASREFTAVTLSFLEEPLAVRAAVFLHGRETIIPRMFRPLVQRLQHSGVPCSRLLAYLDRHIQLDGGAHGEAAAALLGRLCGGEPALVERGNVAVVRALQARRRLWDAILAVSQGAVAES